MSELPSLTMSGLLIKTWKICLLHYVLEHTQLSVTIYERAAITDYERAAILNYQDLEDLFASLRA